jgi:AcrR family transcriptional regulator
MANSNSPVPTGIAYPNAREILFEAAERVLRQDGASGLTSRAITAEAGVAKGVMHRHFADFDAFLAELILDRATQLDAAADALHEAVGTRTVVDNVVAALTAVFSPLAVAMVALVITRDGLRARLHEAGAARFPLMAEGSAMISAYLKDEQVLGRVGIEVDVPTVSYTLIGATHLLFADSESGPPDARALHGVVSQVLDGMV